MNGTITYNLVDCYNDQWHWCVVRNFDGQTGDVICVLQDENGEPLHDMANKLIESLTGAQAVQQPIETGPDLTKALSEVWDVLHAYQDEAIPAEKHHGIADDYDAMGDVVMSSIHRETAEAYDAEWDTITHAMALIHEALGITQEATS